MIERLLGHHSTNLQQSMSQTSDRLGLITRNISNVNTPGYKRQDLEFGIVLQGVENKQWSLNKSGGARSFDHSLRRDGSSVNLEQEMVAMAETEARYRLLTEMTGRYFNGLKNVIREGR